MSNEYEVTASKIAKEEVELDPKDVVVQKISEQLTPIYEEFYEKIGEILYRIAPEKNWSFNEYDEVKSLQYNKANYKEIALKENYYQIKYEIFRFHANYIPKDVNTKDLIEELYKAFGKSSKNSTKPYQYNSTAIRNLWYYKDKNVAVVVRVNYRDYDKDGIIKSGHSYLEVALFMYYVVSEKDLKDFFGQIAISDQIIEQAFNVAGKTADFTVALPLQTISLNTKKIKKKFREYNQLFKLPNADIISLKFTDLRSKVEDFVEQVTGVRECPSQLPRWKQPPEGTLYTSDGKVPDYIIGEFPHAEGKLKDKDVYTYSFRVCTKKEYENRGDKTGYLLENQESGEQAYVIREEPQPTIWEKFINKIFWTDFENSLAFYYNNEGTLQKVNLQGYQDISDNDILRLYYSNLSDTQINLSVATRDAGREAKWFESNPEKAEQFKKMCLDLLSNVKDYTLLSGEDLIELEASARDYGIVNSAVITNYIKKHPEFKQLFIDFYSQVGAIDSLNKSSNGYGNRDAVALAKLMDIGEDFEAAKERVAALEKEHLDIARDPKNNTPFLPKNIKNFNTDISLFAQQAIAVSMANNQKTAILDVDMGGGKTCMMTADICNQMTKGVVKKPLIVCPNKTLVQNKKEIYEKWTAKRMNVFILNTETFREITDGGKNWDKLVEVMNKMPANTIFMTSYNFLTRGWYEVPFEEVRNNQGELVGYDYTRIYPIPKLLLQDVGIDMVYCDESHYIKNKSSGASNAVAAMSGAKYKRITSGTIIPNNPIDLFAQLRFVDPSILGSQDSFLKRYAEVGDGRGKIVKWKDGAQKQIREQIERKGGVSIRRSMWRWMMPKLNEEIHFVNLTPSQAKLYEYLMTLAIEEIMQDKALKEAYDRLRERGEDTEVEEDGDEDKASMKVLSILSKVTGYLAAPATHNLVKEFKNFDPKVLEALAFTSEDLVGPKIHKMKQVLNKHFAGAKTWKEKGKVIVFTERVAVANHAYDYLGDEWQKHAVWYKAGMDSELEKFKTDDDIWILIAVDKSIKEGQNLQVASRIIRLDIPWTPGDINQSYARAYRTGQKSNVAVDIILCDGSMEVCKYNNLISKEYTARKIISSFDEGDDRDFIPVKMNIRNMQEIKWKEMCDPYIAMHKRIDEQELEESRAFGARYKNYFASGISKVGSKEDLPGSLAVYVPEPAEERILIDEEGKVIQTKRGGAAKRKAMFDVDDIGESLELLKGKYDEETAEDDDSVDEGTETDVDTDVDSVEDADDAVEEKDTKVDTGLHLYFFEQDEGLYLITFYNKTTSFLRKMKFTVDPVLYVKPIATMADIATLEKKLSKKYDTNLSDLLEYDSLPKLLKKKKAGALQRLKKKAMQTTAAKNEKEELYFQVSKMEGQVFLTTYDKIDGFAKIAKLLYFATPTKARADMILKKVAKEAKITNLEDLAADYKIRFKTNLDVEALSGKESKVVKTPVNKVVKTDDAPESKKYNGKQIVIGLLTYAKANKEIKDAYKIWLNVGGIDFKKILTEKGKSTNITDSVKYLLEKDTKLTQSIIDSINKSRSSAVKDFLNTYRKASFKKFDVVKPYVSKVSR